jgi:hypothetical protein
LPAAVRPPYPGAILQQHQPPVRPSRTTRRWHGSARARLAPPWWLRAYLLIGAAQGLAIGLTGLLDPAHVVGFPLHTTPLNTRLVASFYLAGAVGLALSSLGPNSVDARIFTAGFAVVTALLLLATLVYWSEFTAHGVPYAWIASYVVDPIVGAFALWRLGLGPPADPGTSRTSAVFGVLFLVFAPLGALLLLFPGTAVAHAPWRLTETLARVYAAIAIALALGAALSAFERRRSAVLPFALSASTLLALAGVVSLVHRDRFVPGAASWIWAATIAGGLVLLALVALRPAPREIA